MSKPRLIWVAVEFGGDFEVKACTALSDLAQVCSFSYETAKRKTGAGCFMIKGKGKHKIVWMVSQVELIKIQGRGKDNRQNFKLAEV